MSSHIPSLLSIQLPALPNHNSISLNHQTPSSSHSNMNKASNVPAPSPLQVLIPANPDPLNQPSFLTGSSFRTPISHNSRRRSVVDGDDGNTSGSARRTLFSNNSSSGSPSDKVANNMKRLYTKITETFDGLDMEDAQQIIRQVKSKHNGLKGLTMKVILGDAIEIVCQMNQTPERTKPGGRGPVTLSRPLHNEPCMDVNCTDFLQYCKWKTELCPHFEQTGRCKMQAKCVYAHGRDELRPIRKLRICNGILKFGYCSYGEKCLWAHSAEEQYVESEDDRRSYNEQFGLASLSGPALALPVSSLCQQALCTNASIASTACVTAGGDVVDGCVGGVDMTGTGIWHKAHSQSPQSELASQSALPKLEEHEHVSQERRASNAMYDENTPAPAPPALLAALAVALSLGPHSQSAPVLASADANVFRYPSSSSGRVANSPGGRANSALLQPFASELFAALSPTYEQVGTQPDTAQMIPKPKRTKTNVPNGREQSKRQPQQHRRRQQQHPIPNAMLQKSGNPQMLAPPTMNPASDPAPSRRVLNETHNGPFSLPGGFRDQSISAVNTLAPDSEQRIVFDCVAGPQPPTNYCQPVTPTYPSYCPGPPNTAEGIRSNNLLLEACRFQAANSLPPVATPPIASITNPANHAQLPLPFTQTGAHLSNQRQMPVPFTRTGDQSGNQMMQMQIPFTQTGDQSVNQMMQMQIPFTQTYDQSGNQMMQMQVPFTQTGDQSGNQMQMPLPFTQTYDQSGNQMTRMPVPFNCDQSGNQMMQMQVPFIQNGLQSGNQMMQMPDSFAQTGAQLGNQLQIPVPMPLQPSAGVNACCFRQQQAVGADIPPRDVAPNMQVSPQTFNVSPNQLENANTTVRSRFEVSDLGFGGSLGVPLQTSFPWTNGTGNGEVLASSDGSDCSKVSDALKCSGMNMFAPGRFCVGCCMSLYLRPVVTLPCKHVLHTECASKWTSLNGGCPLCVGTCSVY